MRFMIGLVMAMGVVIAMNAWMIYTATTVHGGDPIESSYETEAR